jgi:hypothetical protein
MVQNRIPFVGGGDYGLELQPVPPAKIVDYLKGASNPKPFGVAMVIFQSIRHNLVNPAQIYGICRLLEEKKYASLPEILRQMATRRFDLGIGTITDSCSRKLNRTLRPLMRTKPRHH